MRLIAFGCSFAYGFGLDDCKWADWFNTPAHLFKLVPSRHKAYPALIANKLGCEYINTSRPGNSNKGIWYDISTFKFEKDDIALVGWTFLPRETIVTEKNRYTILASADTVYAEKYCDLNDKNIEANLYMSHAQEIINRQEGVKIYNHLQTEDFTKLSWNNTSLLNSCLNSIRTDYPLAKDNDHPGEQAHSVFADMLWEETRGFTN